MPPVGAFIGAVIGGIGTAVATATVAIGTGIAGIGGALGIGALSSLGYGIASSGLGLGLTVGGWAGVAAAIKGFSTIATLASLIAGTPNIGGGGGATQIELQADPTAGISYPMGEGEIGGNLVADLTTNDNTHKWRHSFIELSGAGPIEGPIVHKVDGVAMSYTANKATTDPYTNKMWLTTTLGPHTGWSLTQPASTGVLPEWTADHKMSSHAAARLILQADPNVYPHGSVGRSSFAAKWVKCYDPRLDSNYPGGSGTCDPDDEATWVWSEDPHIHAITYAIGRRANGLLYIGPGLSPDGIDLAAFVEAANISEENAWTIFGKITSRDDKYEALRAICQAGGSVPITHGAKLSCLVSAPRVALATWTDDDLYGACSAANHTPKRMRKNSITPWYTSPDHDWQQVPAAPYEVPAYITAEGRRSHEIRYPLVKNVDQATQLAAYACYDLHEVGSITLTLHPKWWAVRPGDLFSAFLPSLDIAFDVLVLEATIDPQTHGVTVTCRSENPDKHTEALGTTGAPIAEPTATRPDPRVVATPATGSWAASGAIETGDGWVKPLLTLSGSNADNPAAEEVVAYFRQVGESDWVRFAPAVSLAGGGTVFKQYGLISGQSYETAIQYRVRTVLSPLRTFDAVTIPSETSPDSGGVATPPADGTILFDTSVPGANSFTSPYSGEIDVAIWGGGGGAPLGLTDKVGATEFYAHGAGGGGYSVKAGMTLTAGDTINWSVGAGGLPGSNGGNTTCSTYSLTANGGTSGSVTESAATAGVGGTASGGDSNITGHDGGLTNFHDGGGAWNPGLATWVDQTTYGLDGTVPGGGGAAGDGYVAGSGQNGRIIGIYREVP